MVVLELVLGLVLLVVGGDVLVRGAVAVAKRTGLSPLVIGLTLVGFGTSTPELVTSVRAALAGSPGIAVGNVIGSNISNILLILGLAALTHPLATDRRAFKRDGPMVLAAALVCLAVVAAGDIGRPVGLLLVALLIGYLVLAYRLESRAPEGTKLHEVEAEAVAPAPTALWLGGLFVAGGLILTVAGAHVLVGAAIELARAAGLSESVVGLTIVGVGTSLPELVTSVVAAFRRQSDVAFGNIVGSNIYNVLGILGVTAVVRPIEVPADIAGLDVWVMTVATVALIAFAMTGWRLNRLEGAAFVAAYLAYIGYRLAAP